MSRIKRLNEKGLFSLWCFQFRLNVFKAVIGSTLLLSQRCESPSGPLFFLRELSFYPCLCCSLCVLKRTLMSFSLSLSFRKANGELSVTLLSRSKVADTAAPARAFTDSSSLESFVALYSLFLPELGEILTVKD